MILVTGSTGFLGKNVCKKLDELRLGYYTSKHEDCDLRYYDDCKRLFKLVRPDIVINCASYSGGLKFAMSNPADLFYNNTMMMVTQFKCSAEYNVKRFINPISNCVYPEKLSLFSEEEFWDGKLHSSVFVYGNTRKMSYVGSEAYKQQYGLDTVNLVLSNMYGENDHFDELKSHALGSLIKRIYKAYINNDSEVVVWGSGTPIREWLYIKDAVDAIIQVMDIEKFKPYSDILNVGCATGITIKDLAIKIANAIGYKGKFIFDTTKPEGALIKTVDGSKLTTLLNGWKPNTNIDIGIKETVDWYIKNIVGNNEK